MNKKLLTLLILLTLTKTQFILKEDPRVTQNRAKKNKNQGITYKTILIKPNITEYICPDQREACGENYKTYKNRCLVPKGIKIILMARCPYNGGLSNFKGWQRGQSIAANLDDFVLNENERNQEENDFRGGSTGLGNDLNVRNQRENDFRGGSTGLRNDLNVRNQRENDFRGGSTGLGNDLNGFVLRGERNNVRWGSDGNDGERGDGFKNEDDLDRFVLNASEVGTFYERDSRFDN